MNNLPPCDATAQTGFTLLELISVLLIIGIIFAIALPRFFSRDTFDARGYYDQALAIVRYAQKVAIAQHRSVFVNAAASTNTICLTYAADTNCTAAAGVLNPATQTKFSKAAPPGVTLTASVSFSFSAAGKPNPDSAQTLTINGAGTARSITIERETGYVH